MMENYLLLLYVTLDQENAIQYLFQQRGWPYHKTDIQSLQQNPSSHQKDPSLLLQNQDDTQPIQRYDPLEQHSEYYQELSPLQNGPADYEGCQSTAGDSELHCQDETNIINNEDGPSVGFSDGTDNSYSEIKDDIFLTEKNRERKDKNDNNKVICDEHVQNSEKNDPIENTTLQCDNDTILSKYQQNDEVSTVKNRSKATERSSSNINYLRCKDLKSELKLKIERGKKAFMEKKRKQKEEQRREKIANSERRPDFAHIQKNGMTRKKQPVYCGDCNTHFTSMKRFEGHKAKNGGQCVFTCEYCGKVFKYRKSKYLLHIRSAHTKERPYVCQVCGKGYVTSDKLKIHLRVHTGEKPCVCEQCGKSFYSRAELSSHKEYHHISLENQDNMICDICGVTFCSKRYLLYHKNVTHSEQRDFLCNKCEKTFKCNSALQRHLKYMHTETRDFKCEICEKVFKTSASLKKHNVRHGGERNYLCSYCEKAFYEKAQLLQHERIHTGEKPYKCDQCDYRCALSGNLSKHKKIHYRL